MTLTSIAAIVTSCLVAGSQPTECVMANFGSQANVAGATATITGPRLSGEVVDVDISAQAALVWDLETGDVLYEKNADERRPIASLSKILSALTVRKIASLERTIEISPSVRRSQQLGADIALPIGENTTVRQLLEAGLIASANDAMVALAVGLSGSEEQFAEMANDLARRSGWTNTRVANATGLDGGEQYSTAREVKEMFSRAYNDPVLRQSLASANGYLTTTEGTARKYKSTNKLINTYFPVLAAKTGYTVEAGENLVVMTQSDDGQVIGAVVLGSDHRFQDMKTLVEWIWRNYTWGKKTGV